MRPLPRTRAIETVTHVGAGHGDPVQELPVQGAGGGRQSGRVVGGSRGASSADSGRYRDPERLRWMAWGPRWLSSASWTIIFGEVGLER